MRIDLWTDLVCPWCYVGRHRLDRALASTGLAGEATIVVRAFELAPAAARTPEPVAEVLARTYRLGPAEVGEMQARVRRVAEAEGLPFVDDRPTANTFDAHRITALATAHGVGPAVFDALQRGLFTGTADPFDPAVLRAVAVAAGVPGAEVDAVLAGDGYAEAVRADEALAGQLGIRGVPFTVLDMAVGISGAQETRVFEDALRSAAGGGEQAPA